MRKRFLNIITLLTSIIGLSMFSCMETPKDNFIIEKILNQEGKKMSKILEKRYYNFNSNILTITQFSRVGCNVIDSARFSYNNKNQLILKENYEPLEVKEKTCETISYKLRNKYSFEYDSHGIFQNYTDSKGRKIKEMPFYSKTLNLKDSLGLLNDYLQNIYFVKNTLPNKISYLTNNSFSCKTNETIYGIFSEYGISNNEVLSLINVTINDSLLIQDEFIFSNYSLNREYYYNNDGLLKSVIVTTRMIPSKKIIHISEERFLFKNNVK